VSIANSYFEFEDAVGTVDYPPEGVAALTGDWEGLYRTVQQVNGLHHYYWVTFDEPQTDSDGDGPYAGAEIPGWALLDVPDP
jgi:hypothetical protein